MHYTRTANGSISPCRFVTQDSTAGCVVQCGAGGIPFGVSEKATHLPPLADQYMTIDDGFAAKAGESIGVYGPGGEEGMEILLELGATVSSPGTRLKSDVDGKGTTATTGDTFGAINLSTGVAGDFVRVQLVFPSTM